MFIIYHMNDFPNTLIIKDGKPLKVGDKAIYAQWFLEPGENLHFKAVIKNGEEWEPVVFNDLPEKYTILEQLQNKWMDSGELDCQICGGNPISWAQEKTRQRSARKRDNIKRKKDVETACIQNYIKKELKKSNVSKSEETKAKLFPDKARQVIWKEKSAAAADEVKLNEQ